MKLVEQAIFTSVETDHDAGYQVVAKSVGVCDDDARELAVWEPLRDSLLGMGEDAESLNFHPLPSGAYCVSRSTPAGWESSGNQRVLTHCLIVPVEILARFSNNPFAIIQAVSERGLWRNSGSPGERLDPFCPSQGAAPVDQALLRKLAHDPGPESMALLVQEALHAVCLAVTGVRHSISVVSGLFNCLPPECRLEFSFSTGLKFSPRRPFRIVALSDDPAERLWMANYPNVTVVELGKDTVPKGLPLDGWPALIERVLATDHVDFFAAQVSKRRFDLNLNDLPALGLQLLEGLDRSEVSGDDRSTSKPAEFVTAASGMAHAAHQQYAKSIGQSLAALATAPAIENQGVYAPEVVERLEHLDDLVYEAICGQADSLAQLRTAWPKLLGELGEAAVVESREQYLRYALSIWTECVDGDTIRSPNRAIQALDVLCLLFGEQ